MSHILTNKKENKTSKEFRGDRKKCNHNYSRKDGILSCSNCTLKAVICLLPLKK